jgi:hypothetical protein
MIQRLPREKSTLESLLTTSGFDVQSVYEYHGHYPRLSLGYNTRIVEYSLNHPTLLEVVSVGAEFILVIDKKDNLFMKRNTDTESVVQWIKSFK